MITSDDIDRVVVINDYTRPVGGAGKLAMASVELYRARGFPVTVLTGQEATEQLQACGAETVGLGSEGLLKLGKLQALRQGYHNRAAADLIDTWITENDTPRTVYHLHNWSQILSPSIFRPLKRVAVRTVITCHDFFNTCPNGAFVHFPTGAECNLKPLSMGCFFSQCDRRSKMHKYWRIARQWHFNALADLDTAPFTYTALHEKKRQKFLSAGFKARDFRTVVNPVEPWSAERLQPQDNVGLLFVGRVGPDKGTDIALEAARRANYPITIAGTGDQYDVLKEKYSEANFAGWCDRAKLLELARKARLLIAPSRMMEPFGLVLLEAAMSGLPVLVTQRAFIAEEIETIGTGKIINIEDIDSIAASIKALASDDEAVRAMSEAGYNRGQELCNNYETWINAFLKIFEEKLAKEAVS